MINAIPVKIGRKIYHAVLDSSASAQPNALPTYRVYTDDGTYFMHLAGWEFDNARAKAVGAKS